MTNDWTTLVQAEALADALGRDDIVVVDTRFVLGQPDAGESAYRESHVAGAFYAHLDRDLSGSLPTSMHDDAAPVGAGRHPWPDALAFARVLASWGMTPAHQLVAYDAADGAYASRLWCLLRMLGHRRVAVLDGGWARWQALGLPVDAGVPSSSASMAPSRWPMRFDTHRLLDAHAVQRHLEHDGLLVDARAGERFRGEIEPIDRKAGHVPGAVNRPYADNLLDGRFKPAATLAEEFHALLDGHAPEDVVAMCGSGVTACHHLLAMEHAGLPGAKLFTGSWSGWIEDDQRPIARGDA